MTLVLAPIAAALLLVAAPPPHPAAGPGDPIPGREVLLEGDPGSSLGSRTTDARGRVEFTGGEGRYYVLLPDAYTLRVSAVARIELGRAVLISTPVAPSRTGRAYFMGGDGRRLSLTLTRDGPPLRITLTEGPLAAPRG